MKKNYDPGNGTKKMPRIYFHCHCPCYGHRWILWPFAILAVLLMSSTVYGQGGNVQGKAPTVYPPGGFGVDGDALANFPTPQYLNVGDWFSSLEYPGTGGTIFNMSTPDPFDLNYPMSWHWNDPWEGKDTTVFTTANKINDDPNTYKWGEGNVPQKNEINNATVQFSFGDPAQGSDPDHLWCIFAADRMVNNGDSYIYFE